MSAYATAPAVFHSKALDRAAIAALVRSSGDDSPALQACFVEAIAGFAARGLAWSAGGRRIAFRLPRCVAKLPLGMEGVFANNHERRAFHQTLRGEAYRPVAACRVRTNADGIPILLMRIVDPVTSSLGLPDWTLSVDCAQVGLDRRGRLVAYDL